MLKIAMEGRRFGRLVALAEAGTYRGSYNWLCRCDCGSEIVVWGNNLRRGTSQSCGCKATERISKQNVTHRRSGTRTHMAWKNMRARCRNTKRPDYERYGGRGITFCERWERFENFLADMGEMPEGMSLDRIDNDKGYEPANCRWATATQQGRNQRKSLIITFQGRTMHLQDWSQELELPYNVLRERLRNGWTIERAFATPVRPW